MEKITAYYINDDNNNIEYVKEIEMYKGYYPSTEIPYYFYLNDDNELCVYNEDELHENEFYLTREEAEKICNSFFRDEYEIFELCKQLSLKCSKSMVSNPFIEIGKEEVIKNNRNVIKKVSDPMLTYFLTRELHIGSYIGPLEERVIKYMDEINDCDD